jgi:transposase-like protein
MARKHFSEEEVESLKKNPYVIKVSTKSVKFSSEFKQKLQLEMKSGLPQSLILRKFGLDSSMLGKKRMNTLFSRTREQSKRPEKFEIKAGRGRPKKPQFSSVEEENEYLKDRMEYLEQENEFLKKLEALEGRDLKTYAQKKSSK